MGAKSTTKPNRILADHLDQKAIPCDLLWEMRGPKDTSVAWISCYRIAGAIAIVETYEKHSHHPENWQGGWDVFLQVTFPRIDDTCKAVEEWAMKAR